MAKQDIVVIGGSTGSNVALREILGALPSDLQASVFVSTHIPAASDYLADALARFSTLPVRAATDGTPIQRGTVYVAVANHHLLLIDGTIRLGNGPRENMARPSIDPLFRSAALSYGPRAVGVILSGMLNDGASGLWAIKECGGTAIVQHPLDAVADQMPLAALEAVTPDAVASGSELAKVLTDTVAKDAGAPTHCPDSIALEVEIASGARLGAERLREIADPSAINCPDCQGVLSEVREGRPLRYRCQIGHAQTAEIVEARRGAVDEALQIALRMMEERVTLVTRMARDARDTGRNAVAELYEARAEEYAGYASVLRAAAVASLRDVPGDGQES